MSASESSSSTSRGVSAQNDIPVSINPRDSFVLKIQNQATYPSKPRSHDVALPGTATAGDLRKLVCEREKYTDDMFDMFLGVQKVAFPRDGDDKPLAAFGVPLNRPANIRIQRSEKYSKNSGDNDIAKLFNPSSSIATELEEYVSPSSRSSGASDSSASSGSSILGGYSSRASGAGNGMASASSSSSSQQAMVVYNNNSTSGSTASVDWNKRPESGYVGLSNQGATCYMNSLIQSLFMTPEFRRAVYSWSYDDWAASSGWPEHQKKKQAQATKDGKEAVDATGTPSGTEAFEEWKLNFEKASIPRQLQKLFAHLQLSDSRAVQTKNLTKSFGWTDADAFTQHDVQELCRLLFDALEKAWKGTKQENLINELYQGTVKDYVKCSVCGHESAREDKFLDVALAVKAFGAPKAVESVEEALQKFVEPEILNGSNQYFCEKCNTKVDAEKGLKFTSFPYVLMLQLKRFDFDYETMRRVKLNDRVTFPQILDLNAFLPAPAAAAASSPVATTTSVSSSAAGMEIDGNGEAGSAMDVDPPTADAPADDEKENAAAEEDDSENQAPKVDKEAHLFDSSKERIQTLLQNGPAVYELYAILIHRGSANGGHYYAYIKNTTDGSWSEFNDSSVSPVDARTLAESFGASDSGRSYWASSSGTNAYMLIYRQIDAVRNAAIPKEEEIPEQVRNIIAEEERQKQEKEKQKQREREMVKFRVMYKDDKRTVRIHKSEPISKLLDEAATKFPSLKEFSPENIRIRDWNRYNDVPDKVIEDLSKRPEEIWVGTYNYGERNVVLETKAADQEWFPVDLKRLLMRVFVLQNNKFPHEPEPLYVEKDATLAEIREAFAAKFGIPADQQIITAESYSSSMGYGTLIGPEHDGRTMEDAIGPICKWGMPVWLETKPPAPTEAAEPAPKADGEKEENSTSGEQNAVSTKKEKPQTLAPKHIKFMRNRVYIRFNHPNEPETNLEHLIHASGNETVGMVRERIAEYLNMSPDSFVIFKRSRAYYQSRYRYEEVNIDDTKLQSALSMYGSKSEPTRVKIVLKPGTPSRRGEVSIPVHMLSAYPEWDNDAAWESFKLVQPLFEIQIPSTATLNEMRELVLKTLLEKGTISVEDGVTPDRIRVREISSGGCPSKITFAGTDKPLQYRYTSPKLIIQILKSAEPKNDDNQILFAQRWKPDECKAGDVEELAIKNKTPWSEVAKLISEKYGVEHVGIHKAWMMSVPKNIGEIERFDWKVPDTHITDSRMDDGDWFFWCDLDAQSKELPKEEKEALVKADAKKREKLSQAATMSSYHSIREKDLVIKQQDV